METNLNFEPGDIPPSHTGGAELTAIILAIVIIASFMVAMLVFGGLGLV